MQSIIDDLRTMIRILDELTGPQRREFEAVGYLLPVCEWERARLQALTLRGPVARWALDVIGHRPSDFNGQPIENRFALASLLGV